MNSLWSSKSTGFTYIHKYAYVFPSLHMLSSENHCFHWEHTDARKILYAYQAHTSVGTCCTHTRIPAVTRKSPYNKFPFHHSLCSLHSCPSIKQRKMWAACVHTAQTHCNGCKSEAGTLCWCSHYGSHYRGLTAVCAMWATKATELGQKAELEGKYVKAKAKDGWQCAKLHMCHGIPPQTDTHSMITVNFRLLVSWTYNKQ